MKWRKKNDWNNCSNFNNAIFFTTGVSSDKNKGYFRDILRNVYNVCISVFLWIIHGWNVQDYNLIGANAITFVFAIIILSYKIKYK